MMKKLITILFVFLMLWGCSGTSPENENDSAAEPNEETETAAEETIEHESEPETVYTIDDGIIPYLSHSPINLQYDVILKEDQQNDFMNNWIIKLEPLQKESEVYELAMNSLSEEEKDGEMFFVNERHEAILRVNHYYYDQMDPDKHYFNYLWVMKDDPSAKILTIHEYTIRRDHTSGSNTSQTVPGNLVFDTSDNNEKHENRYTVDYSAMNEDDWEMSVIENYPHYVERGVGKYKGYMTVYDPVDGIEEYTMMRVLRLGVRMRSTPEVKDGNIRSQFDSYSKDDFTFPFFVYETKKDSDYTWYRVGKKRWIADDGTWVELRLPEKDEGQ